MTGATGMYCLTFNLRSRELTWSLKIELHFSTYNTIWTHLGNIGRVYVVESRLSETAIGSCRDSII